MNDYSEGIWYSRENYTAYYTNGEGMLPYNEAEKLCETLPNINVYFHDSGMIATHNMPCPVCKTNHAVFMTNVGYFDVCHECREDGYEIVKWKKPWYKKLMGWLSNE